jgi:hypothetical protein
MFNNLQQHHVWRKIHQVGKTCQGDEGGHPR